MCQGVLVHHGMPCLPRLHAPNHLQSSPTLSAYTLVSLQCTLHKLAQVRMPPTISDHLRLRPPTLWCHSDAHCISSHKSAHPRPSPIISDSICLHSGVTLMHTA